ncbi:hypothetical protein [Winogradskyella sp.]|uniref:hypothetical protein n=1 Tax=Winogradskyella sp. TaxID=1883156 RepID=UPI002604C5AD|nr:hypothetical protein [Winogradskyella sp.]
MTTKPFKIFSLLVITLVLSCSVNELQDKTDLETDDSYNLTAKSINTSNFISITFHDYASQQDIDDAISTLNPINHFTCANNPNIIVMRFDQLFPVNGNGRGSGSGCGSCSSADGSGGSSSNNDEDPIIKSIGSIISIQSYRVGIWCN